MQAPAALTGDTQIVTQDLGPLAWVLAPLRQSLTDAMQALRRFVDEVGLVPDADPVSPDTRPLQLASQQLHQAAGALDMVGQITATKLLRAMEALTRKWQQEPGLCSPQAVSQVERSSFALGDYLDAVLKGQASSAVVLFPQYRDLLALLGETPGHPADLWPGAQGLIDVVLPEKAPALAYDTGVRVRLDRLVLKVVKSGDVAAAQVLCDISLGFSAAQEELEARVFWKISAAYFQAVSLGLCATDVYGKRAASRILLASRALARGEPGLPERLLQDLLFFCAQAVPATPAQAPVLAAVRAAYALDEKPAVDYAKLQFGRFDPVLLQQARQRLALATETWSALASGDINLLPVVSVHFSQVTDVVLQLHPESADLVRALTQAIESTTRSGDVPTPALAMEVATAVLYLVAACNEPDPTDALQVQRSASLAQRLIQVNAGGPTQPLEDWMDSLYRRISDREMMTSVVEELRLTLARIEKSLDVFFGDPFNPVLLHEVPAQLIQIRGVFSVLGLAQAAMAAWRMHTQVEAFLSGDLPMASERPAVFAKLGNSLCTLGFLTDMLSYQYALAKKMFIYDEELAEFRPLKGHQLLGAVASPADTDSDADADADANADTLTVQSPPSVSDFEDADRTALDHEEQIRVIGNLRIEIPLYNIYLNEVDEWSRRLLTELSEWALELPRPVFDSTVALAHALAGSSATVGFMALSEIAHLLEQALLHEQLYGPCEPAQVEVFVAATEEIRRLLHQFAAGFLKLPDPQLLAALKASLATETLAAAPGGVGIQKQVMLSTLDVDLFPIFEEEAFELLPQLGGALRQWAARPDNRSACNEALRVLHTLKGSARLAGAMHLGDMTHDLESTIEALGTNPLQASELPPLLIRFDAIQAEFDRLRRTPAQALQLPEVATMVDPVTAEVTPPLALSLVAPTVRVSSKLLDRLLNQTGEVMATRTRLSAHVSQVRSLMADMNGNLDRLRQQLQDLSLQADTPMASPLAATFGAVVDADLFEFDRRTQVLELTRIVTESVHDVATVQRSLQQAVTGAEDELVAQARLARGLQRDLLRTRMVAFESLAERLHAVVRQVAQEVDKEVKLDIQGGALEVDRGVLARMVPVFEHLLRNAVVHGLEEPAQRSAVGKLVACTLTLSLQQQGNEVSLTFSDDGAGLDLGLVREKARAAGLLADAREVTDGEAADLIFAPGLSTAGQVTTLAGRGIGLDVVRTEVNVLGGRIDVSTTRGQGTRFTLLLPLTTAITQVVMLRMGAQVVGVPATLVERVCRVPVATLAKAYQSQVFEFEGESAPFFWIGALLQAGFNSTGTKAKTCPVAVFRSAGQRVALHVDEVLGNQEVVLKNLGPQLSRLPGLTGLSVLASGAAVLIYNPVALAVVYGEQARQRQSLADAAGVTSAAALTPLTGLLTKEQEAPLVLVVDDSVTVRHVLGRLLKREGYRVALAADGVQALASLQEETPALVLSDIEMPSMGGFELLRQIRSDARWQALPVIILSARLAEKHRIQARELGVNHYLCKPYAEEELLGLVRLYSNFLTTP
jgi:chemotaxis protein histidine kinase CheA/CheY-like chemotaxis protein